MRSAGMSFCLLALTLLGGWRAEAGPRDLSRLNLPPGFEIAVYAEVPEARQMALSPAARSARSSTATATALRKRWW